VNTEKEEMRRVALQLDIWRLEDEAHFPHSSSFFFDDFDRWRVYELTVRMRRAAQFYYKRITLIPAILATVIVLCACGTWIGWAVATTPLGSMSRGVALGVGPFITTLSISMIWLRRKLIYRSRCE
jgi:hypothetical protein